MKIGRITTKDYIKANKIANREVTPFVGQKVHKSKKTYSRKNYRVTIDG